MGSSSIQGAGDLKYFILRSFFGGRIIRQLYGSDGGEPRRMRPGYRRALDATYQRNLFPEPEAW
jgi:hypothetical protein